MCACAVGGRLHVCVWGEDTGICVYVLNRVCACMCRRLRCKGATRTRLGHYSQRIRSKRKKKKKQRLQKGENGDSILWRDGESVPRKLYPLLRVLPLPCSHHGCEGGDRRVCMCVCVSVCVRVSMGVDGKMCDRFSFRVLPLPHSQGCRRG